MSGGDWKEMYQAAKTGDFNLVRFHLAMGVDPNYQHPEFMTAPLMECIRFGHLEIAKYLLENGADANAIEHNNTTTAMSIAQMLGNQNAIKLLKQYQE